jgi:ribokinase
MRVHVIGNAAFDEALAVETWPVPGASILCRPLARGPGGKGLNQAVALARSGMAVRLVAMIGDDPRGAAIRAALDGEPLDAWLPEIGGGATDASLVLSAPDGDNCNVTTAECAGALLPALAMQALAGATPGDVLLVQGNLREDTTRTALTEARARGMTTVMNPSPLRDWQAGLLGLCARVFVNEAEAAALGGVAAMHAAGVTEVVVTRGGAGALVSGPEGVADVAAEAAAVRDTTGAGDTFLGASLASALLRGAPLDAAALRAGARAAAIAVAREGAFAALPTQAEFADVMRR